MFRLQWPSDALQQMVSPQPPCDCGPGAVDVLSADGETVGYVAFVEGVAIVLVDAGHAGNGVGDEPQHGLPSQVDALDEDRCKALPQFKCVAEFRFYVCVFSRPAGVVVAPDFQFAWS